jgi:hypothetical protein
MSNRSSIRFRFAGRSLVGQQGDTIATALLRNGVRVFDRSMKRRRKRGVSCFEGQCMSCLLRVDDTADVLACRTPLVADMDVRPQLAMPTPLFDLRAPLHSLGFRLFGTELYYRFLTRPVWANHLWMQFLSRMAGRGRLAAAQTTPAPLPYERRRVPVLVVGGGVSGIGAALAVSAQGMPVLLVDRGAVPGGVWRRWAAFGGAPVALDPLQEPLPDLPSNLELLPETTVLGLYEDQTALAVGKNAAYLIRYDTVIVAAGCYPQVLAVPGADEPLFLPVQGVLRAMAETPWKPDSLLLLDVDGLGEAWAETLRSAGVQVELRRVAGDPLALELLRATSTSTQSRLRLATGEVVQASVCAWSAGTYPRTELIRQTGGQVHFDATAGRFVPQFDEQGRIADGVYACGGCAGVVGFEAARTHGEQVGLAAATALVSARLPVSD